MFPQEAGRQVVLDYRIEGTHPVDRVEAAVNTIEAYLRSKQKSLGIERYYTRVRPELRELGHRARRRASRASSPRTFITQGPGRAAGDHHRQADVLLRRQRRQRQALHAAAERRIHRALAVLADELARVLRQVPGLNGVRSEAAEGEEEIQITVDRARTRGARPRSAARSRMAVSGALRGEKLREFRGSERELSMRLAFRESDRQNIDDLARLPLFLPGRRAHRAERRRGLPRRARPARHPAHQPPDLRAHQRQSRPGHDARRRSRSGVEALMKDYRAARRATPGSSGAASRTRTMPRRR